MHMGAGDTVGAQAAGHAMDYYVYIDILDYDANEWTHCALFQRDTYQDVIQEYYLS